MVKLSKAHKTFMKLVYGDIYLKYHFGLGHPFLSEKRQEFIQLLRRKKFDFKLVKPPRATDKDILLVHTPAYLERLKNMVMQGGGYLSLDIPVNPRIILWLRTFLSVEA